MVPTAASCRLLDIVLTNRASLARGPDWPTLAQKRLNGAYHAARGHFRQAAGGEFGVARVQWRIGRPGRRALVVGAVRADHAGNRERSAPDPPSGGTGRRRCQNLAEAPKSVAAAANVTIKKNHIMIVAAAWMRAYRLCSRRLLGGIADWQFSGPFMGSCRPCTTAEPTTPATPTTITNNWSKAKSGVGSVIVLIQI